MAKLPYIPDKKLYAAVMGACSWIRESGFFNKATNYYADKYGVDADEVKKYVRLAQSNGQKAKAKQAPKKKYYWFAVEFSMGNERNGCNYFEESYADYDVRKGLTADSVCRTISKHDDYMSEYEPVHYFGRVERFESKEKAVECVRKWKWVKDKKSQEMEELLSSEGYFDRLRQALSKSHTERK